MKKIITALLAAAMVSAPVSAFAMTTRDFDNGMRKGINYFNKGLYYEANDEFNWFKEYNYYSLNSGQRKYLDDYISGTRNRIRQWEESQRNAVKNGTQAIEIIKGIEGARNQLYGLKYSYFDKGSYYLVVAQTTRAADGASKYRVYKESGKIVKVGESSSWLAEDSEEVR